MPIRSFSLAVSTALVSLPVSVQARTSTVASLKTAGACNDEYKANKGRAERRRGEKKDFIAACRALPPGTPTPIGATATAAPIAPASVPSAAPTPPPATAQAPSRTPAPRAQASASPGESACANSYAHLPASHTAVQFCDEGQAKARCPGTAVVWVNTNSKIYHHAGANTYGHTKEGAYMCENDATAEGDRLSKNATEPANYIGAAYQQYTAWIYRRP